VLHEHLNMPLGKVARLARHGPGEHVRGVSTLARR
jgi:hypothetical protein